MSLKTIIYCFIALKLSCNIKAIGEVRQKLGYCRTLTAEKQSHARFEKTAWSECENYIASFRNFQNKSEIFVWSLRKKSSKNNLIEKRLIKIKDKHIENIFWGKNQHLIVIFHDSKIRSYQIFTPKNITSKDILTVQGPSSWVACSAINHQKNTLAVATHTTNDNTEYLYIIDQNTKTPLKKINITSLYNSNIISIAWHKLSNIILLFFADGTKATYFHRTNFFEELKPKDKAQPLFIPFYRKQRINETTSVRTYYDLSKIKFLHNSYYMQSSFTNNNKKIATLSLHKITSDHVDDISDRIIEKKAGIPFMFDVSSDENTAAYAYCWSKYAGLFKQKKTAQGTKLIYKHPLPIVVYDLKAKREIWSIEMPLNLKANINDLKISPHSNYIATTHPNGIFVTHLRPLPSLQKLKYREMGIKNSYQARINKLRKKHVKKKLTAFSLNL